MKHRQQMPESEELPAVITDVSNSKENRDPELGQDCVR